MDLFPLGCAITLVFLALLLAAEWFDSRAGVWLTKPVAAAGFLLAAYGAGALDSSYGRWVFAALVLCFFGDVLLIPDSSKTFLAGLVSFLLGHLGFAVAFLVRGIEASAAGVALLALVPVIALALRWLRPHVEEAMSIPVYAYIAVISAMVVASVGAVAAGGPLTIAIGAVMFYVSDLAVARQRFVSRTFWNKTWGLPLYFGGQLVLASTVL